MAAFLRCRVGEFPFKHLGLLVGANMNLVRHWKPVIDLFRKRLSVWKSRTLSYGGRVTLVKSVLNALPTYFFSLYRAPVSVVLELEKIRRRFLWGGTDDRSRMGWVAWEQVVLPVGYGGLGLGSLAETNVALLAKWWWRFKNEQNSLWRKVIWAIHHTARSWSGIPARVSIPGAWRNISYISSFLSPIGVNLEELIQGVLGSGSSIMFWKDRWLGQQPLYQRFPELFGLERYKYCCVSDRIKVTNGVASFIWMRSRIPYSVQEMNQFAMLLNELQNITLTNEVDRWRRDGFGGGEGMVKQLKQKMVEASNQQVVVPFKWSNWVLSKVSFVAWRARLERLPTRSALARRRIFTQFPWCPMCNAGVETAEHVLFSCIFAHEVWQVVASWCKLRPIFSSDLDDLLAIPNAVRGSCKFKKIIYSIFLVVIWSLWNARNELLFESKLPTVVKVIKEVKVMSHLWISNRARGGNISWQRWKYFDVGDIVL